MPSFCRNSGPFLCPCAGCVEDGAISPREVMAEGMKALSLVCPKERGMESVNPRQGLQ